MARARSPITWLAGIAGAVSGAAAAAFGLRRLRARRSAAEEDRRAGTDRRSGADRRVEPGSTPEDEERRSGEDRRSGRDRRDED